METNAHLTNAIESIQGDPKLDKSVKELLADKQVLARILKSTTAEFRDMEIPEIMTCIEGEPEIEKVPIEPGLTNAGDLTDKIVGDNIESNIPGENTYYFDIRFFARTKAGSDGDDLALCGIKVIINVEAQREYYVGYDIVTRGVYYASRLISSQYGTEFVGEEYDNIKKVYSIWLCLDPPDYASNSIVNFKLTPEILTGKIPMDKIESMKYDLMDIVMVFLSTSKDTEKDELCGMLEVLLDDQIEKRKKLEILSLEYNMETTIDLERRINTMCDYSVGIRLLPDELRELMEKILFEGRTWDEMESELYVCRSTVANRRRQAIKLLDEAYAMRYQAESDYICS